MLGDLTAETVVHLAVVFRTPTVEIQASRLQGLYKFRRDDCGEVLDQLDRDLCHFEMMRSCNIFVVWALQCRFGLTHATRRGEEEA
jgi:hypothetical protein